MLEMCDKKHNMKKNIYSRCEKIKKKVLVTFKDSELFSPKSDFFNKGGKM
jgi:hypothetical protein